MCSGIDTGFEESSPRPCNKCLNTQDCTDSSHRKLSALQRKAIDISERGHDWLMFAFTVLDHIETYTVPQYGDKGKDQFTKWPADLCLFTAEKYQNRRGKSQRPGEELLDIIKQVHCLQVAHDKIKEEKDATKNSR